MVAIKAGFKFGTATCFSIAIECPTADSYFHPFLNLDAETKPGADFSMDHVLKELDDREAVRMIQ